MMPPRLYGDSCRLGRVHQVSTSQQPHQIGNGCDQQEPVYNSTLAEIAFTQMIERVTTTRTSFADFVEQRKQARNHSNSDL